MIQVQAFLKNHLNKFNIGTGSGQTIFVNGHYDKNLFISNYDYEDSGSLFIEEQTLSHQQDMVDMVGLSYIGGNDADLTK